jgi:hypothetical protein
MTRRARSFDRTAQVAVTLSPPPSPRPPPVMQARERATTTGDGGREGRAVAATCSAEWPPLRDALVPALLALPAGWWAAPPPPPASVSASAALLRAWVRAPPAPPGAVTPAAPSASAVRSPLPAAPATGPAEFSASTHSAGDTRAGRDARDDGGECLSGARPPAAKRPRRGEGGGVEEVRDAGGGEDAGDRDDQNRFASHGEGAGEGDSCVGSGCGSPAAGYPLASASAGGGSEPLDVGSWAGGSAVGSVRSVAAPPTAGSSGRALGHTAPGSRCGTAVAARVAAYAPPKPKGSVAAVRQEPKQSLQWRVEAVARWLMEGQRRCGWRHVMLFGHAVWIAEFVRVWGGRAGAGGSADGSGSVAAVFLPFCGSVDVELPCVGRIGLAADHARGGVAPAVAAAAGSAGDSEVVVIEDSQ